MKFKTLYGLVRWSIEEYLSFPMLELVISTALIGVLAQITTVIAFTDNYSVLYRQTGALFTFLTFGVCAVFAHVFAGGSSKGEDKLLLSYPIKRWHLFVSKFVAIFLTFVLVYFFAYSMHLYLSVLSPFEPLFYVGLFSLLLQILLACGITTALSLLTKNEAISILASILLLMGVDSITGEQSYLSAQGRIKYLSASFGQFFPDHTVTVAEYLHVLPPEELIIVILIPLLISVCLLVLSFVYFNRFMEVD